jgi:O-antigen/teichoic acid export membrane protein
MPIYRRLFKNTIANSASLAFVAIIQLLSVPLLAATWGAERYGMWLMLSSAPTYFALTDLGFSVAATSEMTMACARNNRMHAVSAYQSVWLLSLVVNASILLAFFPLLFAAHLPLRLPHWVIEHGPTLYVLLVYAAVAQCSRIVLAGLRSNGLYAEGTFVHDGLMFLESAAVLLCALTIADFLYCALTYLFFRVLIITTLNAWLHRAVPHLRLGFRHASADVLCRLSPAAFSAMAFPLAFAINTQGLVLIAGGLLSPASAAILVPVRTVSRLAVQMTGALNRATMPEFAAAYASQDRPAINKVIRLNLFVLLTVLLPGSIAFALLGDSVVSIWTRGVILPDKHFVAIMAAAMFAHGIWHFSSNLLLSINKHICFSKLLVFISMATLASSYLSTQHFGLIGLSLVLLASEIASLLAVVYVSLHLYRLILSEAPSIVCSPQPD